ncbi:hypothetical protein H0H92_004737 [Tricholoma furcatifolium]|nr:hypothetical protein H0H92_004737 [Tricholoma furcatifolium]
MWAKLSNVLKPRGAAENEPSSSSHVPQENVMNKVFEQHPNMSVFQNDSERKSSPSPPPSPSKGSKRNMFKRLSKAPFKDDDSVRAPSPFMKPLKKKSGLFSNGNNSQASLSKASTSSTDGPRPTRRSSFDMLRPANDLGARQTATISAGTTLRRPSLDMLRFAQDGASSDEPLPMSPTGDGKYGSVRSILRDPKTPGTGQNVRFFSRDAFKVISPDQSMEGDFQSFLPSPSEPPPPSATSTASPQESAFGTPMDIPEPFAALPAIRPSNTRATRRSVAEVFSPMDSDTTAKEKAQFIQSTNSLAPIAPPDFNDLDLSQTIDLPQKPPGLGFDITEPSMDTVTEMLLNDDSYGDPQAAFTSTPFKDKGKGRAIEPTAIEPECLTAEVLTPKDETVFHSPSVTIGLHDRSQSFSFGQPVFHSATAVSPGLETTPDSPFSLPSAELKASPLNKGDETTTAPPAKSRSRALSDTILQNMIRASSKPPEADANDDTSPASAVYSTPTAEQPDPFRANAKTYYTPQTMIPITPPQGAPRHVRKTSKEDSIIFSLQTQLALQTELCQQYENDLQARDELLQIFGKKLSEVEKEDAKKKSILRTWKKKVQELEKTCRYLEEEVEGSRQSSMERSIMDEASGEALRMLHRQISVLEKEKSEWVRKEEILREELATLEGQVKERGDDVQQVQDSLRSRDANERELQAGLHETKEQMEQVGNVTRGLIDEEELEKLMVEKQLIEEERERHRVAEFDWDEERANIMGRLQDLEAEKSNWEAELENASSRLAARDEEFAVLKAELDAQWGHAEKSSEKIAALAETAATLEAERDTLQRDIEELEQKVATSDAQHIDDESKKVELETQLQELWDDKEELEREKAELEDQLLQERENFEVLTQQHTDRISELEQERHFSEENVARLEEKLRQRDEDDTGYLQQATEREAEADQLREEMANLHSEHTHAIDELKRALQDARTQEGGARAQLEDLVRQQATAEMEVKTSADKISALKEEIENQRRRIQVLQQESADKEVKLLQLNKQHQQDKEDIQGLNTALDSKQMELELIKRSHGVRGTAGATPAPGSRASISRRESALFATPMVSRPPSVTSDAGSTVSNSRKSTGLESSSSAIKVSTLGKSVRPNGTVAPSAASKRIEGSMGPPPVKRSTSTGATSPVARVSSLSKSTAKPTTSVPVNRRVTSLEKAQPQVKPKLKSTLRQAVSPTSTPTLSEQEEKENVDVSSKKTLVPIPA